MKRIISVLIVVVLMASAFAAMIPASAAKGTYTPDIPSGSYVAYDKNGNTFALTDWHNYFITTKIGDVLAAKKKNVCDNAVAYISTMQFTITSTTKYEYVVYARNNASNSYTGIPFAISTDNKVYFAYGCFDNKSDNVDGESYLITAHGSFDNKYPSPSNELGDEYHEPFYQENFDYTVNNGDGTTKAVYAPFATLKFVYEGLTVKVYVKNASGQFVQMGHDVTLASGSKLVYGIYCRDTSDGRNRTGAIKAPKITGLNTEAVDIMEAAGANVVIERDTSELEDLIKQVKSEYSAGGYTEESWEVLETALRQAELTVDDEEASEEDLLSAKQDLEDAILGLEPLPLDTTELEQLIKDVKSLEKNKDKYNLTSYNFLMKTADEAAAFLEGIEDNDEVTQADVVAVIDDLKAKISNLKLADGSPAPFEPVPDTPETENPGTQPPETQPPETQPPETQPPVTVDKNALKAEIDACKLLKQADWQSDANAWTAFAQELANADVLYAKADATQAEVDAMVTALQTKKAALKKTVVKTTLKAEIDHAKKYVRDAWQGNADAWAAFEQELAAAEALYAKADATQEEVDAMATSLQGKKADLKVTIYNINALAQVIEICKTIKQEDWQGNVDAWNAFAQDLAAAEVAYDNPDVTNEEVNGFIDSLQALRRNLVRTPVDKTALKAEIDACKLLVNTQWQGDVNAWNAFAQELVNAEALYANANAPQANVDAMLTSLQTKKAALKETPQATETETGVNTDTQTESGVAVDTGATTETQAQQTYTQPGGCGGAIVTTSVIVGLVSTLGAALVIKKKD